MNSAFSLSRIAQASAVLVLGMTSTGSLAESSFGTAVDNYCNANFQTKPFDANGCGLCHYSFSRSVRKDPEWTWYLGDDYAKFCVVQGIIDKPEKAATPPDLEVSQNGLLHLEAHGFSPVKGKVMTFNWGFSDRPGDPPLTGAILDAPMPNAGDVKVTLTATDGTSQNDGTPLQYKTRDIRVSTTPTVANPDKYSVQSGNTLTVRAPGVLANDTGVGALTSVLATSTTKGALTLNPNGGFSYTPNPGYTGADSFTYTATNGVSASTPAKVGISVTAAIPTAIDDRYTIRPCAAAPCAVKKVGAATGVLANDQGSGRLRATLVRNTTQGSLALFANGAFDYTPRPGLVGSDSFSYTAKNGAGVSSPATVVLSLLSCVDADQDRYSPEGGNCGPIDCDDQNPAVHPGAKEICDNAPIDDNCNGLVDAKDPSCNGKDCIGNYQDLASKVKIKLATWSADRARLFVTGNCAVEGASVVNVFNAATGDFLGTAPVTSTGTWSYINVGLTTSPCRVRAEVKESAGNRIVSSQRKVLGAPASCAELPSCP